MNRLSHCVKISALLVSFGLMQILGANAAMAAAPIYLGVDATIPNGNHAKVLADLRGQIIAPLDAMKNVKSYYNYVVMGPGSFRVGLVAEGTDAAGELALSQYVQGLEQSGFNGIALKFQPVDQITESVDIVTGKSQSRGKDGSLPSTSDIQKNFTLKSVTDWETFTNQIGAAFLSKNSADFQNYLTGFLGGPASFAVYAEQVLTQNDVVAATFGPVVILQNGTRIDATSAIFPFFNLPFVRNCWAAGYEHGMCFTVPPK